MLAFLPILFLVVILLPPDGKRKQTMLIFWIFFGIFWAVCGVLYYFIQRKLCIDSIFGWSGQIRNIVFFLAILGPISLIANTIIHFIEGRQHDNTPKF